MNWRVCAKWSEATWCGLLLKATQTQAAGKGKKKSAFVTVNATRRTRKGRPL